MFYWKPRSTSTSINLTMTIYSVVNLSGKVVVLKVYVLNSAKLPVKPYIKMSQPLVANRSNRNSSKTKQHNRPTMNRSIQRPVRVSLSWAAAKSIVCRETSAPWDVRWQNDGSAGNRGTRKHLWFARNKYYYEFCWGRVDKACEEISY